LLVEGVIQLASISDASVAQIDEAQEVLGGRLVSVQNSSPPPFRSSLAELEHDITLQAWSPFQAGLRHRVATSTALVI
jgi:aryl-alcohol dehydrogenase-like predicted oxidoreductase